MTELLITSDLHYGLKAAGDRQTEALAAHAVTQGADALVLVGDLGKDPDTIGACLDLFRDFPGVKLALPGNHDIWRHGWGTDDSWRIHETLLPALFESHGFHPLHLSPKVIGGGEGEGEEEGKGKGGVACVGSMGWYDYSFRDDIGIDIAHYRSKTPPWAAHPIWNDARFARFDLSDEALTLKLASRLTDHLTAVSETPSVLAFIHHVAARSLLVHPREIVPRKWRYANAFLGSDRYSALLEADGRVQQVFCGHIHMARSATLGQMAMTTLGSDYRRKELIRATPSKIVSRQTFEPNGGSP